MDAIGALNTPAAPQANIVEIRQDPTAVAETGVAAIMRPDTPAPTPASLAQQAVVTRVKLAEGGTRVSADGVKEPERVLKPFGVAMLPDGPSQSDPEYDPGDHAGSGTPQDA